MIERKAVVQNEHGIHCRPSTMIVKHGMGYQGKILVSSRGKNSDLKSILDLISMELYPGSEVSIRVDGPNEKRVCDELVELFERHFDFPPIEKDVP